MSRINTALLLPPFQQMSASATGLQEPSRANNTATLLHRLNAFFDSQLRWLAVGPTDAPASIALTSLPPSPPPPAQLLVSGPRPASTPDSASSPASSPHLQGDMSGLASVSSRQSVPPPPSPRVLGREAVMEAAARKAMMIKIAKAPARPTTTTTSLTSQRVGRSPPERKRSKKVFANHRACVHCGTRYTSQWRMGPMGASTLCNACGIRHMRYLKEKQTSSNSSCTQEDKAGRIERDPPRVSSIYSLLN